MQHSEWLTDVNKSLVEAYDQMMDNKDDANALAVVVSEMHIIKQGIADLYEQACNLLAEKMGDEPEITTDSGVVLEKRTGAPRKAWKHDELGRDVAHKIIQMSVDMDTGEVLKSQEDMILEMLQYAAPSYWRVKPLSKIGIVADEYCELGDPKTSIIVRQNA